MFEPHLKEIERFINSHLHQIKKLPFDNLLPWKKESSLILEKDTALELGNPKQGSLHLVLWKEPEPELKSEIFLLGKDLPQMTDFSYPFAQVIIVYGNFSEAYECFSKVRDVIYQVKLKGMMPRYMPSRQVVWLRVNQEAKQSGLSLRHLGQALIQDLLTLDFISQVKILFITSSQKKIKMLKELAREVQKIQNALIKMVEEESFDCEVCEYQEVCATVAELKKIRNQLLKAKR